MSTSMKTLTKDAERYVRRNSHLSLKELSENTGVNIGVLNYFITKNNLKVKKRLTSVDLLLLSLSVKSA